MLKSLTATIMKRSRSRLRPKLGLVPDDGCDQRVHRVFGLVQITGAHVDLQQVLLAFARAMRCSRLTRSAATKRKQVAGLGMRIVPDREVATTAKLALFHQVAVGQQHRELASCQPSSVTL
jgi:hypothetical protein